MTRAGTRERGVALLLTLGVLSLLLILAMSFAFTARTERAASVINADLVRARLLCESGLARAVAYLRNAYDYEATLTSDAANAPRCLFPATDSVHTLFLAGATGSLWDGRYYAVSMQASADQITLESALAVNLGFDFTPPWPSQTGTNVLHANASWHPVKDVSGNLIGRLAFLVVDESGKLDPNGVITAEHEPFADTDSDGSWDAGEHFFDVDRNGAYTNAVVAEGAEARTGGSPQEINGEPAFPGMVPGELVTRLPANAKRWFSWRHLRRSLWATGAGGDSNAQTATKSAFPFSYDIEAWRHTDGNDKHRFNLARTDWASLPLTPDQLATSGALSDFWDTSTTPATITAVATDRVPWLTALVKTDGTTSVTNQVAANLIDYSDADDTATSDYVPATGGWPLNPPNPGVVDPPTATYVGLEEVPYVNEVAVTCTFSELDTSGPPPAGTGPWQCQLQLTVFVELINPYANNVSGDVALELELGGSLAALAPAPAVVAAPAGSAATVNGARLFWPGAAVGANGYQVLTGTVTYTWMAAAPVNYTVAINDGAATVTAGGSLAEFARLGGAGNALLGSGILSFTASCDYTVADPRVNTQTGDWTVIGLAAVATTTVGTRNVAPQADANPSGRYPGADAETVTDPALGMSTAYIRNAPMQSLWELGCIHRGEPWCTLNLATSNPAPAAANTYAGGDANILEQVKLGPDTVVEGRFNANSSQAGAWSPVLSRITIGGAYDTPEAGTVLTAADITAIVDGNPAGIRRNNGTLGGIAAAHRGGIAMASALSSLSAGATAQDTDRKKEEVVGKLANLLTVRQNYFTVIVTGQVVKDLGAMATVPSQPGIIAWNDAGTTKYCRVLAEQKIVALVYRDAFSNRVRVDRFEYVEE